MCVYSTENVPNRPAKVGDSLVTRPLGEHNHIGLVDPTDPGSAVCVPDGSRVIITGALPELHGSDQQVHTATMHEKILAGRLYDVLKFDSIDEPLFLGDFDENVGFSIETIPGEETTIEPARAGEPAAA